MDANESRCAQTACHCQVAAGDAYCSEHCRKRVESPLSDQRDGCDCGHRPCNPADQTSNAPLA